MVDRQLSDELTRRMPIVPHDTIAGTGCSGYIVAAVEGATVELDCSECGAVVGVVRIEILKALLGLDCARTACPHCGRKIHLPGLTAAKAYVCHQCGNTLHPKEAGGDLDPSEWVVRVLRRSPPEETP